MPTLSKSSRSLRLQPWLVQLGRAGLMAALALSIHYLHQQLEGRRQASSLASLELTRLRGIYGEAAVLGQANARGGLEVLGDRGEDLGYVIQTSPESDRYLGFSGPTNVLLAFDPNHRLIQASVLSSRDTRDHVQLVQRDQAFWDAWKGRTWEEIVGERTTRKVAGATLTSNAILQGLYSRLGGEAVPSQFEVVVRLEEIKKLFAEAASYQLLDSSTGEIQVFDQRGEPCGRLLSTTPTADTTVGYQGPSRALIAVDPSGQVLGISLPQSFDNDPYVGYVQRDRGFASLFTRYTLDELARLDLKAAGIEGVSGATMTSMAVAEGILATARKYQQGKAAQAQAAAESWRGRWRWWGTLAVVALGCWFSLASLQGRRGMRLAFQLVVIFYLGLMNGELLSMAMFVGWAEHGIPWRTAGGLGLLAAVLMPIMAKSNVYCSQLCPHGAVQQLLPRGWKVEHRLPGWGRRLLLTIRPLLLAWVVVVVAGGLSFSLVDIEPFDAYVWRVAAWPSVVIAIGGLVLSLFIPMGYCRYGCVTGSLLNYLRRHPRSHRWQWGDAFAAASLAVVWVAIFLG